MDLLQIAATVISLVGCVWVIRKSRWGFAIWAVANLLWIAWAEVHQAMWLGLTQGVFLAMGAWGFLTWTNERDVPQLRTVRTVLRDMALDAQLGLTRERHAYDPPAGARTPSSASPSAVVGGASAPTSADRLIHHAHARDAHATSGQRGAVQ